MVEKVHDHIIEELKTNNKTDIIFVIAALILNFIGLIANTASKENLIVMFVFIALIIVVNVVVEIGLLKSMQTRKNLLSGLIKMYEDKGVDQYYDKSILKAYDTRYKLFMFVILFTGLVAITVPFLI